MMMMMMMILMMMIMMMTMVMTKMTNFGQPMLGDIHVVASGHRETAALKLIVIYIAGIQN